MAELFGHEKLMKTSLAMSPNIVVSILVPILVDFHLCPDRRLDLRQITLMSRFAEKDALTR